MHFAPDPTRVSLCRPALALVVLALALAGCGSGGDDPAPAGKDGAKSAEPAVERPVVTDRSGEEFNPSRVYDQTIDGVVAIRSMFGDGESSLFSPGAAGGSGFVLNDDGEIITNAHVISTGEGEDREPAQRVFVEFTSGDVVPAKVLGLDPFSDIGLLRVDPAEVDLQPLELGDSDELTVGEPIAVIGSPFGEDQSLTTGVVSQTGRSVMSLTDFRIEGAIQTDASINPGNSGGPMLDGDGRVIAISQQMKTGSGASNGVGFGVPVNTIKWSSEQLRDQGKPSYAYIGVSTQALYPQLAEKLGIDAERGAILAEVIDGGPAERAGLRGAEEEVNFQGATYGVGGDVIVAVDGEPIERVEDLGRIIAGFQPGDEVEVEVVRDGRKRTVEVTLQERPTTIGSS